MKGKKSNKSKKLPKKKLSTAEAIALTRAPKQPKPLKILDKPVSLPKPIPEIVNDSISLKDQLTAKEMKFLEIFCSGEVSMERAMVLAGYETGHPNSVYYRAHKIIKKYESQTEDTRKIFQDIRFGQLTIAQGIKNKALNAKSEMVSLNAYQLAARCTRMLEEPQASHQGVNIIINCGTEPAGGSGAPARPVNVLVQGSDLPSKPLQITK